MLTDQRNLVQDSTTARTVLAATLEIISASGDDLNLAYLVPQQCPLLKCFHFSATPMEQIHHVTTCSEASRGEIRCWTCRKCHDFKRWHAVCNTLRSPVDLLRRLSTRKRGSNTSTGEPSATKRGKIEVSEDFALLSRNESHGVETVWPREMEDPTSLFLSGATRTSGPAQLHANEDDSIRMPPELGDSSAFRPLPTPPSTRNQSWSEDSQNSVAYGDAKFAHMPEQPPPYVVSPQTTVDDYERHDNATDSLRLGIPPVQYIRESPLMESPQDIEIPEAPWDDHEVFNEPEVAQASLPWAPAVLDANVSAQYSERPEKSASIFFSSSKASRAPNLHRQKQDTWLMQLHHSIGVPNLPFDSQQRPNLDGITSLAETDGPAATTRQQDTRAEPSVARRASFDAGTQESITVSTAEDRRHQTTSLAPAEDEHQARGGQQQPQNGAAVRDRRHHRHYEQCERCGQRFGGAPKNRRQHLKRHVASKHGDVRFRCGHPACGRSYNRVDNLHDHERKCHGPVAQAGPAAELAAGGGGGGGGEVRGGGGRYHAVLAVAAVAEADGSAPDTGYHAHASNTVDTHLAVFGYSIPTDRGHGWCPADDDNNDGDYDDDDDDIGDRGAARRTAGFIEEDWDVLMAGVSGGQSEGEEGMGPDAGHEDDTPGEEGLSMSLGLAPRPLDLPCAPWRVLGG